MQVCQDLWWANLIWTAPSVHTVVRKVMNLQIPHRCPFVNRNCSSVQLKKLQCQELTSVWTPWTATWCSLVRQIRITIPLLSKDQLLWIQKTAIIMLLVRNTFLLFIINYVLSYFLNSILSILIMILMFINSIIKEIKYSYLLPENN